MHRKLILLVIMAFIFSACGKSKEVDKPTAASQPAETAPQAPMDTESAEKEPSIPQVSGQPKTGAESGSEAMPEAMSEDASQGGSEMTSAEGQTTAMAEPESGTAPATTAMAEPESGAAPATTAMADTQEAMLALAKKSGCLACHKLDTKVVGPSWKAVAERYNGDPAARERLIAKVSKGGKGNWTDVVGNAAMPPYSPRVSQEDIGKLVDFVLGLK